MGQSLLVCSRIAKEDGVLPDAQPCRTKKRQQGWRDTTRVLIGLWLENRQPETLRTPKS
jgi:hypothetical protein